MFAIKLKYRDLPSMFDSVAVLTNIIKEIPNSILKDPEALANYLLQHRVAPLMCDVGDTIYQVIDNGYHVYRCLLGKAAEECKDACDWCFDSKDLWITKYKVVPVKMETQAMILNFQRYFGIVNFLTEEEALEKAAEMQKEADTECQLLIKYGKYRKM